MNESTEQVNIQKKPSRRRYIIAAGIIICVVVGYIYWVMTYDYVDYESRKQSEILIRKIVAEQFNKDPNKLTDEDFAAINQFGIEVSEITDIKLLEKFTNLQWLVILVEPKLAVNKIPTLKLILYKVGIIDSSIRIPVDLSPLENLSNLQTLEIMTCQISHLEKLRGLKKLQTLRLDGSKVSDFKPLNGLNSLQKLELEGTQISSLKPLNGLTNLRELYLTGTPVSDLKPLKGLINLRLLNLFGTRVSDLKPLNGLTNLLELYLNGTQVSDLEPLKELTNLRILNIMKCPNITDKQVEDLQKALPKLKIIR